MDYYYVCRLYDYIKIVLFFQKKSQWSDCTRCSFFRVHRLLPSIKLTIMLYSLSLSHTVLLKVPPLSLSHTVFLTYWIALMIPDPSVCAFRLMVDEYLHLICCFVVTLLKSFLASLVVIASRGGMDCCYLYSYIFC